jgi:hypothetical protein
MLALSYYKIFGHPTGQHCLPCGSATGSSLAGCC